MEHKEVCPKRNCELYSMDDIGGVCNHSCTCPKQNMEEKKCMCGEHQLGYFIISERIGETIHSRESPCWVIEKEDHTKCRKLGTSDLCVCCPCGCDTPMDAPNYAELHGAPTEQKEEWMDDLEALKYDEYSHRDDDAPCASNYTIAGNRYHGSGEKKPCDCGAEKNWDELCNLIRNIERISEERGRRDTITAFVEWAGKQEWLNKGDLLKFADSLKSNLTQKS